MLFRSVYAKEKQKDAIQKATSLQKQGISAVLAPWKAEKAQEDYQSYANRMQMQEILFIL